jgi:hypothetical protein
MEILDGKFRWNNGRSDFTLNEVGRQTDAVERLFGFFSLTKEERLRAGIYVGKEGREWIEKSALIFPLQDLE